MRTRLKQEKKPSMPKVKGIKTPREERKPKSEKPMKRPKFTGMM